MSTAIDSSNIAWFYERLRGDNIILRLTVDSQGSKPNTKVTRNIAHGEAFAYYVDAEMPVACHIVYKAWYDARQKKICYSLTQTPFSAWTAEWPQQLEDFTSSWGSRWKSDESNVFLLLTPDSMVTVQSHPTILSHLSRMHGMLVCQQGDPYARVLTEIAARRIDGAITQMNRSWTQSIGI